MDQNELKRQVTEYIRRKEKANAAYVVFRQDPTAINANRHMTATHDLDIFCRGVLDKLAAAEHTTNAPTKNEILNDIDNYKTCKRCGKDLLFVTSNKDFVKTSDFLENFKGHCYSCVSEYCVGVDCAECILVTINRDKCSFKPIKDILTETV